MGLFMMWNTHMITRTRFRMLVLAIFLTLIYDIIWFYVKNSEFSLDMKYDGGNEMGIRRFSLIMSYVSFIVRVRAD